MQRLAVIAKLKPGAEARAAELVDEGPPFNPKDTGFERHTVFLSGDHAVFVFEGGRPDQLLQQVIRSPGTAGAFRNWEPLVEGMPRVARQAFFWERGEEGPDGWGE